jgi:hypothetical protein
MVMKLNIFEIQQIKRYRNAYDQRVQKKTEEFWRAKIALEIVESCVNYRYSANPCEVCEEHAELIILRNNRKKWF